jgi:uncharacterized protein (DUF433 family)
LVELALDKMMQIVETLSVPLRTNKKGVIRVGQSRVRLDTVVFAFNEGCTAEEIVSRYPSLKLGEVYAVIAYYLDHQAAVDEYVKEREKQREKMRQEIQAQPDYRAFRDRLLRRKEQRREQALT